MSICIKKKLLLAAGLMVLTASSSVLAEIEVKPYGSASYRYRGRLWTASADDSSATTFDHLNQLMWQVGLKAKVDDRLSLQFQIGNDWYAGESVSWSANNSIGTRTGFQNLYVHLAYARWNPGYIYMDVGVIPATNVSLDLLERSLSTGSYNEAVYLGWAATGNNSLIAARAGVPVITEDDMKLAAEATVSVIDPRTQRLTTAGDMALDPGGSKSNHTSFLMMLALPLTVGDLKVTPEAAVVFNRNYSRELEAGDHERLAGFTASYKVKDGVSVSFMGAYGIVSNEFSRAGHYGGTTRSADVDTVTNFVAYYSNGIQVGAGTAIKAGPGTFAFDLKYGNSFNDASEQAKTATNTQNIYIDPRYTWRVHPNFTISPRCRFFVTMYDEERGDVNWKMEVRPELTFGGTF